MEASSKAGFGLYSIFSSGELRNPSTKFLQINPISRRTARLSSLRSSSSPPVSEIAEQGIMQTFLIDRQLKGDFVSKVTDVLWRREDLTSVDSEASILGETQQELQEVLETKDEEGFLKLTRTQEWVSGDENAPVNKKVVIKEVWNDTERRKRLNLLQYDAIKREMMLLTIGVGTLCSGYCLVALGVQVATSYAVGVLLSCLYLQLLYYHVDNLSREAVPQIFRQMKQKRIGIRSEDLSNSLERLVKGSAMALSSPRLMMPAVIYGLWAISDHLSNDFLHIQVLPAMVGLFAYKAAALVQVYRDNEDLKIIFPEMDEV